MNFEIDNLFSHREHIPLIADWIYDEFWADQNLVTREWLAAQLKTATGPEQIPLSLIAMSAGEPLGTVNLIENDDEKRAHLRPWLAALFVVPEHRGNGVGSARQRRSAGMVPGGDPAYRRRQEIGPSGLKNS